MHSINVNGSVITIKTEMAELFNNYFIDQPCRLFQSVISSGRATINGVLRNQPATPFSLSPITSQEVEDLLNSIPTNKATGADGVSARIVRIAASAISISLSKIINYCIENSKFPSAWKVAKVIPIYKGKGDQHDMSNYRPISVLPVLSKLFERHVSNML